jgi:hypothetical protein
MRWKLPCLECGAPLGILRGIVCVNFGEPRSPTTPICDGAWHAECYRQKDEDNFPVLQAKDLDNSILEIEDLAADDPDRFRVARAVDHMMYPFQCDECHFVNLHCTSSRASDLKDGLCLLALRRAILNSFWARETATVDANRREAARYIQAAGMMGVARPYPRRGPFPMKDEWGMMTAMILLLRSREKGKNAEFVQYETIRKVRSHYSNFIHTTPGGVGDIFIPSDSMVNGISRSGTNTLWFKRFMKGCHSRMGDVWCPDRPLTMRETLLCQEMLEEDWKTFENNSVGRLKTALTGVLITAGLGGGMRGEEIIRIHTGIIRKHWSDALSHPDKPHVPLGMSGRFKRQVGVKVYVQPLAIESVSGLKFRLWMHRALQEHGKAGTFNGPIFRVEDRKKRNGEIGERAYKRAKVRDLDNVFRPLLVRVQNRHPETIGPDVNVEEEYIASRSLKRGATSQARNQQIPPDVIEANNRWRKIERARGSTPHMSLLERYADGRAVVPLLVRFTKEL